MVSSKEILKRTGLRNIKTLTRWHQKGIIPKPVIRNHPSGRGKMAYWPDWVLDRCIRIVELQRKGHSLNSAVAILEMQSVKRIVTSQDYQDVRRQLAGVDASIELKDGRSVSVPDLFVSTILVEIQSLLPSTDAQELLASQVKSNSILQQAVCLLSEGFSPVLLFNGADIELTADFVVSHRLSNRNEGDKPFVAIPLLPVIKKIFAIAGIDFSYEITAHPSQKVLIEKQDELVEQPIHFGRFLLGFKVLKVTAAPSTKGLKTRNIRKRKE